jgi:hypothetical protein
MTSKVSEEGNTKINGWFVDFESIERIASSKTLLSDRLIETAKHHEQEAKKTEPGAKVHDLAAFRLMHLPLAMSLGSRPRQHTQSALPNERYTMTSDSDFQWTDKTTTVRAQLAIAVYTNAYDEVVIRQADSPGDDSYIAITLGNVPAVVAAMLKEVGIAATFNRQASATHGSRDTSRDLIDG